MKGVEMKVDDILKGKYEDEVEQMRNIPSEIFDRFVFYPGFYPGVTFALQEISKLLAHSSFTQISLLPSGEMKSCLKWRSKEAEDLFNTLSEMLSLEMQRMRVEEFKKAEFKRMYFSSVS